MMKIELRGMQSYMLHVIDNNQHSIHHGHIGSQFNLK